MTYGYIVSEFDAMDEDTRKSTLRKYIEGLFFNERAKDELDTLFSMELNKAKQGGDECIYYLELQHTYDKEGDLFRRSLSKSKKEQASRFTELRDRFASDLL